MQTRIFNSAGGDIVFINADVITLKYAQAFYGTDATIVDHLRTRGISGRELFPGVKETCYIDTQVVMGAAISSPITPIFTHL